VREQEASGMSVAAFCRERGLRGPQLFAWRRKLRTSEPAPASEFVAVKLSPAASDGVAEIHGYGDDAQRSVIEVHLGTGRSVAVWPGFDGEHLRAVIHALEQMPAARGQADAQLQNRVRRSGAWA